MLDENPKLERPYYLTKLRPIIKRLIVATVFIVGLVSSFYIVRVVCAIPKVENNTTPRIANDFIIDDDFSHAWIVDNGSITNTDAYSHLITPVALAVSDCPHTTAEGTDTYFIVHIDPADGVKPDCAVIFTAAWAEPPTCVLWLPVNEKRLAHVRPADVYKLPKIYLHPTTAYVDLGCLASGHEYTVQCAANQ